MKLSAASILLFSLASSIEASPADDESNFQLLRKKNAGGDNHLLRRAFSDEASNLGDLPMKNEAHTFQPPDDDSTTSRHLARRAKSTKNNKSPEVYIDGVCTDYCDLYFETCATNNIFLNPEMVMTPKGSGGRRKRNLQDSVIDGDIAKVISEELDQPRSPNLISYSHGLRECRKQCMKFPRGRDPATYPAQAGNDAAGVFNSNLGGDTIWCRKRHLSIVTNLGESASRLTQAAFHCPHAGNPSAGICRDSTISIGDRGEFTPYEHLRVGQPSRRHFGFCDLAADDTIAECTASGITDANIGDALKLLPSTIEVLFMNGNQNITALPNGLFQNLKNPGNIQAIYFNDCAIAEIEANVLKPLTALKIFNADANSVTELPGGLFKKNPDLAQFSMFFNFNLGAIPKGFFQNTPKLERLVLYATSISTFEKDAFKGLTKLEMLSFVNGPGNGPLNDDSFPDGIFDDLVSLKFLDFFGNKGITNIPKSWFESEAKPNSGWGRNLLRLAFWRCGITKIEAGAFDTLESLEQAYFHINPGLSDFSEIENLNPDLVQLTVGP